MPEIPRLGHLRAVEVIGRYRLRITCEAGTIGEATAHGDKSGRVPAIRRI